MVSPASLGLCSCPGLSIVLFVGAVCALIAFVLQAWCVSFRYTCMPLFIRAVWLVSASVFSVCFLPPSAPPCTVMCSALLSSSLFCVSARPGSLEQALAGSLRHSLAGWLAASREGIKKKQQRCTNTGSAPLPSRTPRPSVCHPVRFYQRAAARA